MSFSSGQSCLIELPPEQGEEPGEGEGYLQTDSPDELMAQFALEQSIMDRVLYRGDLFASYRILGFIGAGGMGEVYAAERLDQDGARRRAVALKVLSHESAQDSDLIARLEREARLCNMVRSRHVVRFYEYGMDDQGRGFVAMELLRGEELFERMKHHKVVPLKKLGHLAIQILRSLHAVHAAGLVHRDIKPENIFLAEQVEGEELVKLLDFGIARMTDDPDDPLVKNSNQLLATPQYMSPEQTLNPVVDHRSDLYSLGVLLYECAAGNPPFDGETPYATMLAHQKDKVPLLPSTLDPEFCEIIYKTLTKKPQDRWQSAREMAFVIQRWIDETSWVDELPGESSFENPFDVPSVHDDLFSGLTAGDDARRAPTNETPMFGATSAQHHTPHQGAPRAMIRKRPVKKAEFDPTRGLFEEVGAAPAPYKSPEPVGAADHSGLFDFGSQAVGQAPLAATEPVTSPDPQVSTPAPLPAPQDPLLEAAPEHVYEVAMPAPVRSRGLVIGVAGVLILIVAAIILGVVVSMEEPSGPAPLMIQDVVESN